jgi:hypothetical protein
MSADNCFPVLNNPVVAQRLMDEQLKTDWPAALKTIAHALNPLHDEIFQTSPMDYQFQRQARGCSRQTLGPRQLRQDV